MDETCVNVKRLEENEEQCTDEDKTDQDKVEEKLISSNERSWKPWQESRSRIRGEVDHFPRHQWSHFIKPHCRSKLIVISCNLCSLHLDRVCAVCEEGSGVFCKHGVVLLCPVRDHHRSNELLHGYDCSQAAEWWAVSPCHSKMIRLTVWALKHSNSWVGQGLSKTDLTLDTLAFITHC